MCECVYECVYECVCVCVGAYSIIFHPLPLFFLSSLVTYTHTHTHTLTERGAGDEYRPDH
jgi:hypothetical protein